MMKKLSLIICTCISLSTTLHATFNRSDEDFEPIFKAPPSITSSLTKIAAGTAFALIGDYLYPHEQRNNTTQQFISEGPSIIGHTLIMNGIYDLAHWGYHKYMSIVWGSSAKKGRKTRQPTVIQQKEVEQRVSHSWNRISTGCQIGISLINSAFGAYYFGQTTSQIILGNLETSSYLWLTHPIIFSASCAALYHSAKSAKTYLRNKDIVDYEPPVLSIISGLGQGIAGSYITNTYGASYTTIGASEAKDCLRLGFTPTRYIDSRSFDDPSNLIQSGFFGQNGYWQCVRADGSFVCTHTGELLTFCSESKVLQALKQIAINAVDSFRARAIVQTSLEEATPRTYESETPIIKGNTRTSRPLTSNASWTGNNSYYGSGNSGLPKRYIPPAHKDKIKTRGTPWKHDDTEEHRDNQEHIDLQSYNLEGSVHYQALQQINQCRRFNTVKKAYIDTLLSKTCKFVNGYLENDPATGKNIVLTKNDRTVRIFYEEPHGKSSCDYTGYKLKRVLNAMETAYAYRWTEDGIRAYLAKVGRDAFYTVPQNMLAALWAPESL